VLLLFVQEPYFLVNPIHYSLMDGLVVPGCFSSRSYADVTGLQSFCLAHLVVPDGRVCVLIWNVTDWNALSSLEIITTGSYSEIVDQYTEQ